MIIKQVHLSQQAKEQLSRLKGRTGIQNWNVLCRWALCLSLSEPSIPPVVDLGPDSNVEMSWQVFGGEHQELYEALIVQRCLSDELDLSPETIHQYFRLHLHRGISFLSATNFVKSLSDLLNLAQQSVMQ